MKGFAKLLFASVVVSMVAGCASDVIFIPKVPPHAQAKLLGYYAQPDNKVFVLAVDPSGDYAFGYDVGKEKIHTRCQRSWCNQVPWLLPEPSAGSPWDTRRTVSRLIFRHRR